MANKRITTTALDFDDIKTSLKTYLQGQSQFSDYDFEGSGLSILLDVLAYNTHYNALYTNLAVNEAFLDSASKRASVVSKAKELGYVPHSSIAATAIVNLTINVPAGYIGNVLSLNRGAVFNTTVEGTTYSFTTVDTRLAYRQANSFVFNNVVIKEGIPLQYKFTVGVDTRYIIPNPNVDLSTLKVQVQENSQTSNFTTYVRSDNILTLDGTSLAYFVKEIDGPLYEIEFGDGVLGKALDNGNLITIDYIACNASLPNNAGSFRYNDTLPANGSQTTVTVSKAYGGVFLEDIESIKWNAPRSFAAQNRCITTEDFKTIITTKYPSVDSVNVWGGETNIPPSYGDVFVSIKPADGIVLSEAEKSYVLTEIIGKRRVVTLHPKLVDPAYINLELNVSFYYDPARTTKTTSDLATIVQQVIVDYNNSVLEKFDGVFRYSQLSGLIDSSEQSITNNIITFKAHRPFDVVYNQAVQYQINFANPIYNSGLPEESVLSTGLNVLNTTNTCYIDDVPTAGTSTGVLRLFYYLNGVKTAVKNIGTVDYATGILKVNDLIITSVEGNTPEFIIKTQSNDVTSSRNHIVTIAEDMLTITPIINTTADDYKFASSRN